MVERACAQNSDFQALTGAASPNNHTESDAALRRLARLMGRLAARGDAATEATDGSAPNTNLKDIPCPSTS